MTFGRYLILPCTVKYFRPGKLKQNKKGEWKRESIPMYHRHIWFVVVKDKDGNPVDNGMVWRFTSTKQGRWSDSRDRTQETSAKKSSSMGVKELSVEITRLTSTFQATQIIGAMEATELDKVGYADMIGASLIPAYGENEDGEEYETTIMEGGLLDRLIDQTAKSKANHVWSKVVNR